MSISIVRTIQSILLPTHFLKIHFNIISPSTPGSPKWLFPSGFPTKALYTPILSSSLCSFLHYPITSSLVGPNFLLNTLFSNTLSLRSSLHMTDQVSYPYKTTGKIIVLHIEIFKFLDSKLEDKSSRLHLNSRLPLPFTFPSNRM